MMVCKLSFVKSIAICLFIVVFNGACAQNANRQDTLRLFLIGNSFSQNATRYLPQLAEEGNYPLVIGRAELGGCSLQRHWELAELAEKNPDDRKGKPYKDKSLRELLSDGKWHVVTLQQNSMNSGDVSTYRPYAENLYNFIKSIQPEAKVVFHQTWAYRSDSRDFSRIAENKFAKSDQEMWEKSRAAYHTIATELGIDIIPVGDAFWKVSSQKKRGYNADPGFDETRAVYPELPLQKNSLHRGYFWNSDKKLGFDSHHAGEAGCFLGSLVWYTYLFGDSPSRLKFVPEKVPDDFASYLKRVANAVVKK